MYSCGLYFWYALCVRDINLGPYNKNRNIYICARESQETYNITHA